MSASVGSCNVSSEDYNLFQYPSVTTITNLESNDEGILGPEPVKKILSEVSDAEANMPSVIEPTDISKLWIVLETIEEREVKIIKKSMRDKPDNICLYTS